ncbi:hypothetical protein [Rheinheimera sp. D18]|uniref:hypothetical protein n=1 Tax=Rheinheimera sp. D18 TaxID=2545632 RepID=UPI001404AD6A|nr:hypothetical protein [Rheinheimera sp. D18]
MIELDQNELTFVQGAGIVYEIAKFFGYANQSYSDIDWGAVGEAAKITQENYKLRD